MAKSILDILIRTITSGEKKPSELSKSLIGLKGAIGTAGVAFVAFAGAALVADKVLDATVGKYVEYANEVERAKTLTGASAEETSRIIQLADDLGISYENLTKSLTAANKDGVQPNIDGLAALSDEFNTLKPGVEQNLFLLDKFGKSGVDMGKVMKLGGDGVRAWAASIDDSLLITEKGIQQAHEYAMAQDNLGEAWEKLALQGGQRLLPVVTDLINSFNDEIRTQEILTEQGKNWFFVSGQNYEAAHAQAASERERAEALRESSAATAEAVADAEELSAEYKTLIDLTVAWATADEKAKKKMAFNNIMAKLSIDGLTEAEKNMGENAGIALGIFDESAISAAERMEYLVDKFAAGELSARQFTAALNAIPDSVNVNINTNYTTSGGLPTSGNYNPNIAYATGGPFDAGQPMLVHKDEIMVPDYGGVVLTRTDAMRLMEGNGGSGGGKTFINYGTMNVIVQGSVMDVLDELS